MRKDFTDWKSQQLTRWTGMEKLLSDEIQNLRKYES